MSVSYPLPGTKFHQIVSAQLGVKQNWSDSADLSMMFRGTYPTEFYRALTEASIGSTRRRWPKTPHGDGFVSWNSRLNAEVMLHEAAPDAWLLHPR